MLEFDDIQYLLLKRVPAVVGRYEFLSFHEPAQGRAWLRGLLDKIPSAQQAQESAESEKRWVVRLPPYCIPI
jgi:transposase